MSKILTIDDIMIAFVTAVFYAAIDVILEPFGLPKIANVVLSIGLGAGVEEVIDQAVFSEAVQKKPMNRFLTYAGFVALFVVASVVAYSVMSLNLVEYLADGIKDTVVFAVGGFAVTMVIRTLKALRIRERYGEGKAGYVFDVTEKEIEETNQKNRSVLDEYDAEQVIRTKTGSYVGKELDDDVCAYLGIPYAKPPVGELRWKAPQPLEPSAAVSEAKNFGDSAVQVEHAGSIVRLHRQSEDALTLNVFVANDGEDKKPVIVLFHHGDFSFGGSADPLLYGDKFVAAHPDVVFVSFDCRLGLFGFIDFSEVPGGEDFPDTLNLGLLDQVAALTWVHENIAAFGGDPDRVTAVGFESGATSIALLAATESARGLFRKALVFFGSPDFAYTTPEASRFVARHLLEETKTTNMDELMALDTETLKEAEKSLWRYLYAPTCDGVLVPADPYEAYQCGVASDIEFIFGIPTTEARVVKAFIGQERFECMVSEEMEEMMLTLGPSFEERFQKYVEEHQDIPDKIEVYAKFVEQWRALSMYYTAANLVKGGATVRLMYWDEEPLIENLGSGTVDVVASMLGNNEVLEMHGSLADDDVSESLQGFLAKFAKGEELKLYPNEIKGFAGIVWEKFPKALIVSNHEYSCDRIEDKLMDCQSLREMAEDYL